MQASRHIVKLDVASARSAEAELVPDTVLEADIAIQLITAGAEAELVTETVLEADAAVELVTPARTYRAEVVPSEGTAGSFPYRRSLII